MNDVTDDYDTYNTARDLEGGETPGRGSLFTGLNLVVGVLAAILLAGAAALLFIG